jgi:hypothetical protein
MASRIRTCLVRAASSKVKQSRVAMKYSGHGSGPAAERSAAVAARAQLVASATASASPMGGGLAAANVCSAPSIVRMAAAIAGRTAAAPWALLLAASWLHTTRSEFGAPRFSRRKSVAGCGCALRGRIGATFCGV